MTYEKKIHSLHFIPSIQTSLGEFAGLSPVINDVNRAVTLCSFI